MRPYKPLVYVAGPFTSPSPSRNTNRMLQLGVKLIDENVITPFIPHLSFLWDVVTPQDYDWWLDYDLDVIRRCDGLLRVDGESPGADRDVAFAASVRKPVFMSIEHCYLWARRWTSTRFASTHEAFI